MQSTKLTDNLSNLSIPNAAWLFIGSLILFLLSGCQQTLNQPAPQYVRSIHPDNVQTLQEGHGYLLMAVTTNLNIRSLFINGPINIALKQADLESGTNYILVPLPQGQYNISEISMYFGNYSFDKNDYWNFEVMGDTISYIGDLQTEFQGKYNTTISYELRNRSSYALEFLENKYPTLLKSKTVVYSGFGEDRFLEFMTQKSKANTDSGSDEPLEHSSK